MKLTDAGVLMSSSSRDMVGMLCFSAACAGLYQPTNDPGTVECDACGLFIPRWLTKREALNYSIEFAGSDEC